MKIIPVIDILDGVVVHGTEGKRDSYEPIDSILTNSHKPLDIVRIFENKLGTNKLYIADLNSIAYEGNNFQLVEKLSKKCDAELFLDAGIEKISDLKYDVFNKVDNIIIATESVKSLDTIKKAKNAYKDKNIIVSIDMKKDKIIHNLHENINSIEEILNKLIDIGINSFILLDISKVGTMSGLNNKIKDVIKKFSSNEIKFITGGGIRNIKDVQKLEKVNISGLLIASAIHNGNINSENIKKYV